MNYASQKDNDNQKYKTIVICPWSLIENQIYHFKQDASTENLEKIFKILCTDSSHADFWEKLVYSYKYIEKYEKATKLIEYLENENETLNELLYQTYGKIL